MKMLCSLLLFFLCLLLQVNTARAENRFHDFDWGESMASVRQRYGLQERHQDVAHHLVACYSPGPKDTGEYYFGSETYKGYGLLFWNDELLSVIIVTKARYYSTGDAERLVGPSIWAMKSGLTENYGGVAPIIIKPGDGRLLEWTGEESGMLLKSGSFITTLTNTQTGEKTKKQFFSFQASTYSCRVKGEMPNDDWEAARSFLIRPLILDEAFKEFGSSVR